MSNPRSRPGVPPAIAWPVRARPALVVGCILLLGSPGTWGEVLAQPASDGRSVAEVTGTGPLETAIEVQKLEVLEGPDGRDSRRWVAAGRLNVGDEIHYTVRVRNPGRVPVTDVVVTKRLPFGVRYLRGSASGPAVVVQFSIDGGKTFATPEALARAARSGLKAQRRPLENDYTHVRWQLRKPLGPAATALLRFRATFS